MEKRLQVILTNKEPSNEHVLWLNTNDNLLYRYSADAWTPINKIKFPTAEIYDPNKEYEEYSLVQFEGSSYIALKYVPINKYPSNSYYWLLFAKKGEQGLQGNSGYQGNIDELEIVNNLTQGGETAALSAEQGKLLNEKKVDKEKGKQLSTEDFTTLLKNKLEGLNNYNDRELRSIISTIENRLNVLIGTSASEAIDNFNEIVAFLENIEDSTTLESVLISIENQISAVDNKKVDKVENSRLITEEEVAAISKNTADIKTMDGKYLAATPSGNPNHNLYTSLGAVWSDAGWQLNGVPLTNEEIDVSYLCSLPYLHRIEPSAWGHPNVMFQQKFKTNFYAIGQVPYNTTQKVIDGNSIGYASHALEVVRFQSSINQTTYKTFVKNCSYMFGNCPKLREIKDYLDVSLSTTFVSAFGYQTTSLETIWLIGLKASIDFSGTSVLKKECLLYMIQKAAPTSAITITVHADVYAWASTDAEVQAALAAQPLVTLKPV